MKNCYKIFYLVSIIPIAITLSLAVCICLTTFDSANGHLPCLGRSFKVLVLVPILLSSLIALFLGIVSVVQSSFYAKKAGRSIICVFIELLLVANLLSAPKLLSYRKYTRADVCQQNLSQIETAKEISEKDESGKSISVSTNSLLKYFEEGLPVCPDAGHYFLDGTNGSVYCTIHGALRVLPE